VFLLVALVVVALVIMASAFACAWRHGSLRPSEHEIVELEFERIVAALVRPSR
jgi:hypothetical protein